MFKGCVAFRCITEGITVVRSKTKTTQEKTRVAPRRKTWIIKDIVNKKDTTWPSSRMSEVAKSAAEKFRRRRAEQVKNEVKEFPRRRTTKG